MNRHHTPEREALVNDLLQTEKDLPQDPKAECIVIWKTFRSAGEALEYSRSILLEAKQHLVGGHCEDTMGTLYWIGVQVEDLAAWGNSMAIQLRDPFDSNDPKGQGHGISI